MSEEFKQAVIAAKDETVLLEKIDTKIEEHREKIDRHRIAIEALQDLRDDFHAND